MLVTKALRQDVAYLAFVLIDQGACAFLNEWMQAVDFKSLLAFLFFV